MSPRQQVYKTFLSTERVIIKSATLSLDHLVYFSANITCEDNQEDALLTKNLGELKLDSSIFPSMSKQNHLVLA